MAKQKKQKKQKKIFPRVPVCFLIFFVFAVMLSCGPAWARRKADNALEQRWERSGNSSLSSVEGGIEDVTFRSIEVAGNFYAFDGVPISNEQGKAASPAQFIRGREVQLFFRRGVLIGITVFEHRVIQ